MYIVLATSVIILSRLLSHSNFLLYRCLSLVFFTGSELLSAHFSSLYLSLLACLLASSQPCRLLSTPCFLISLSLLACSPLVFFVGSSPLPILSLYLCLPHMRTLLVYACLQPLFSSFPLSSLILNVFNFNNVNMQKFQNLRTGQSWFKLDLVTLQLD